MVRSMSGKKILLLSPFFYPELISTGKYNTSLAKALVKHGHSIEVVTSFPLYPTWRPQKCYEVMEGVESEAAAPSDIPRIRSCEECSWKPGLHCMSPNVFHA